MNTALIVLLAIIVLELSSINVKMGDIRAMLEGDDDDKIL